MNETVYTAFGDASTGDTGTFYGFVLLPENHIEQAENKINEIKEKYNGKSSYRIHCYKLFSSHERAKSEWAHLDLKDIINMWSEILTELNSLGMRYVLGVLPPEHYPKTLRLRGKNGYNDLIHNVDNKWRELWTYYRAAAKLDPVITLPPPDPKVVQNPISEPWWRFEVEHISPGFKVNKVYLDREDTTVQWFSKRFKWTTIAKDFVLRGAKGPTFLPIQSNEGIKHSLLDVADIFVWNVARSLSDKEIILNMPKQDVDAVICASFGEEIVFG